MDSGPVVAMIWEGLNVIKLGRVMLGENYQNSNIGTIRGDFQLHVRYSICHASDSVQAANREIDLWFPVEQRMIYDLGTIKNIYE